jgi:hypothetical protein
MENNSRALSQQLQEKWQPILDHKDAGEIQDSYKRACTAILLENQEQYLKEAAPSNSMGGGFAAAQATSSAGDLQGFDPVLISLVRRAMPQMIAYDVCGVQPMSGPTGLIFAMKAKYVAQGGNEALFNEADTDFSGAQPAGDTTGGGASLPAPDSGGTQAAPGDTFAATGSGIDHAGVAHTGNDPLDGVPGVGRGMTTAQGEALGSASSPAFAEMAFTIERIAVEAKSRALKAEYSSELAQDLKAVHGLDAETELANILSNEILAEINREVVRTIYSSATLGVQQADVGASGVYDVDTDSDGRWSAEKFRGLAFQIEREANVIAKETRRGKGNMIICNSDVASALSMSGLLDFSPVFGKGISVDDTGNTFAGVLNGRFKVYIDPYYSGSHNYVCVGYKGDSPYDAGMFYCPYVPLQMVRAVGENTFQPKIGFKTRYGLVKNPFASTALGARGNEYYRIFSVTNLHGVDAG